MLMWYLNWRMSQRALLSSLASWIWELCRVITFRPTKFKTWTCPQPRTHQSSVTLPLRSSLPLSLWQKWINEPKLILTQDTTKNKNKSFLDLTTSLDWLLLSWFNNPSPYIAPSTVSAEQLPSSPPTAPILSGLLSFISPASHWQLGQLEGGT